MLHGRCVPRTFASLRIARHNFFLPVVGCLRKDRNDYKIFSYTAVLGMTNCERTETTICKRDLWFAGPLAWWDERRLPKRVMHGRLPHKGPRRLAGGTGSEGRDT